MCFIHAVTRPTRTTKEAHIDMGEVEVCNNSPVGEEKNTGLGEVEVCNDSPVGEEKNTGLGEVYRGMQQQPSWRRKEH